MQTIYTKIQHAVVKHCPEVRFEEGYPRDHVVLPQSNEEILEDDTIDTLKPLVKALRVIADAIEKNGTIEDDIEVRFCHLPGEEQWGIAIGDGR